MNKKIDLWEYQQDTIDNIFGENGIYTEGGCLAEVILPTGAGKSYIALQSLLNVIKYKDLQDIKQNNIISDTSFCYLSPVNLILKQFRKHLLRYVIQPIYTNMYMPEDVEITNSDVLSLTNNILSDLGYDIDGFEQLSPEETINLTPREIVMKTVDTNLRKLSDKVTESLVKRSFPNFDFRCYQSTNSKSTDSDLTIKGKKTTANLKRYTKICRKKSF